MKRPGLLLPQGVRRGDKSALHQRAEQWEQNRLRSFAVVTISGDGEVNMDFELKDMSFDELCMLGAGVKEIFKQLQTLAAQRAPAHGHG